jgi:hypothetical protein
MEKPLVARIESNQSEVACLRTRIMLEYQAAMRAMHDPAMVTPHSSITKRMELISDLQEQLISLVGAQQATRVTWEALEEGSKGE